ncbi:MAG: hypothetical protein INF52_17290 [Rhodobacter sp.]|nr:hypothetical protein [Rhodobacter sp.]
MVGQGAIRQQAQSFIQRKCGAAVLKHPAGEGGGELRFSKAVAQSEETERRIPCFGRRASQEIALQMGQGASLSAWRLPRVPSPKPGRRCGSMVAEKLRGHGGLSRGREWIVAKAQDSQGSESQFCGAR